MPLIFRLKVRREVIGGNIGRAHGQAAAFPAFCAALFWAGNSFSITQSCAVQAF